MGYAFISPVYGASVPHITEDTELGSRTTSCRRQGPCSCPMIHAKSRRSQRRRIITRVIASGPPNTTETSADDEDHIDTVSVSYTVMNPKSGNGNGNGNGNSEAGRGNGPSAREVIRVIKPTPPKPDIIAASFTSLAPSNSTTSSPSQSPFVSVPKTRDAGNQSGSSSSSTDSSWVHGVSESSQSGTNTGNGAIDNDHGAPTLGSSGNSQYSAKSEGASKGGDSGFALKKPNASSSSSASSSKPFQSSPYPVVPFPSSSSSTPSSSYHNNGKPANRPVPNPSPKPAVPKLTTSELSQEERTYLRSQLKIAAKEGDVYEARKIIRSFGNQAYTIEYNLLVHANRNAKDIQGMFRILREMIALRVPINNVCATDVIKACIENRADREAMEFFFDICVEQEKYLQNNWKIHQENLKKLQQSEPLTVAKTDNHVVPKPPIAEKVIKRTVFGGRGRRSSDFSMTSSSRSLKSINNSDSFDQEVVLSSPTSVNNLIHYFCSKRKTSNVSRLYDALRRRLFGISPDIRTVNILLQFYATHKDLGSVLGLFGSLLAAGRSMRPDVVTYNTLLQATLLHFSTDRRNAAEFSYRLDHMTLIRSILMSMKKHHVRMNIRSATLVMRNLALMGLNAQNDGKYSTINIDELLKAAECLYAHFARDSVMLSRVVIEIAKAKRLMEGRAEQDTMISLDNVQGNVAEGEETEESLRSAGEHSQEEAEEQEQVKYPLRAPSAPHLAALVYQLNRSGHQPAVSPSSSPITNDRKKSTVDKMFMDSFLLALGSIGKIDLVRHYMQLMSKNHGMFADSHSYHAMFRALSHTGNIDDVLACVSEMKASGIKWTEFLLAGAIQSCCKERRTDMAISFVTEYLDELTNGKYHEPEFTPVGIEKIWTRLCGPLWSLVLTVPGDDVEKSFEVWKKMRSLLRRPPGLEAYYTLLYNAGRAAKPEVALKVVYAMKKEGYETGKISYFCFIKGLAKRYHDKELDKPHENSDEDSVADMANSPLINSPPDPLIDEMSDLMQPKSLFVLTSQIPLLMQPYHQLLKAECKISMFDLPIELIRIRF